MGNEISCGQNEITERVLVSLYLDMLKVPVRIASSCRNVSFTDEFLIRLITGCLGLPIRFSILEHKEDYRF